MPSLPQPASPTHSPLPRRNPSLFPQFFFIPSPLKCAADSMAAKEGIDRAHSHRASTGGGSEFFICFTARLSSTSRAHSSKSLMSPGRTAPSLSASLSRRLRSGSVKGAQSPMFPGGGGGSRRRAFEAAEPSSPKVTCIGQVRVKAKKKNVVSVGVGTPVARTRSQREASFRREPERECLPNRNQSWVYQLPLSICEALRAIGSEVNCFVPCKGGRSPCFSSSTSPSKVKRRSRSTSSCGAVFARWLMAIDEEGEEEERGEVVDLVVEGREKGEVGFLVREMEKEVEIIGLDQLSSGDVDRKAEVVVVEEEGRVSVCIPPRNALLLMRCRSDPARVAALADRFWGSPASAKDPVLDDRDKEGNAAHDHKEEEEEGHVPDLDVEFEAEAEKEDETEKPVILPSAQEEKEVAIQEEEATSILSEENVGVAESNICVEPEAAAATGEGDEYEEIEKGRRSRSCSSSSKPGGRRRSCSSRDKERRRHSFSSEQEARRKSLSIEKDGRRASFSDGRRRRSFSLEKDELAAKPAVAVAEEHKKRNQAAETGVEASKPILVAEETQIRVDEGERKMVEARAKDGDQLPDCLLQMMYEPKLSMEVSKETWVCSDDFLRWRPHRPAAKPIVGDSDNTVGDSEGCGEHKGEVALEAEEEAEAEFPDHPPTPPPLPPPVLQPSTPLPTVIVATERKVISSSVVVATAAAYGVPLVLTRCNSEPVRSSARLAPDVGFWKSRHQPIGAAEVGF